MAPTQKGTRKPVHLYLDFDSTLTTASTLSTLVSCARAFNPQPSAESAMSQLTAAYVADRQAHDATYPTPASQRTTFRDELRYEASLEPVERASVERVEKTGVFAHVPSADAMMEAGAQAVFTGKVRMRDGWEDLVRAVRVDDTGRPGARVTVLSVSWSRAWIRGCLQAAAVVADLAHASTESPRGEPTDRFNILACTDQIRILANEVDWSSAPAGKLDRRWRAEDRGIWTGVDKKRAMQEEEDSLREEDDYLRSAEAHDLDARTVYVGDSPTDLACLVAADVGVCIRGRDDQDRPSEAGDLEQLLARVGIGCSYISEYAGRSHDAQEPSKMATSASGGISSNEPPQKKQAKLWWAGGFDELAQSPIFCDAPRSPETG